MVSPDRESGLAKLNRGAFQQCYYRYFPALSKG
jgi:hypothetical protein